MSKSELDVNLRNVFADGQAYVAISRATCFESLKFQSYEMTRFRDNKQGKDFYMLHQYVYGKSTYDQYNDDIPISGMSRDFKTLDKGIICQRRNNWLPKGTTLLQIR